MRIQWPATCLLASLSFACGVMSSAEPRDGAPPPFSEKGDDTPAKAPPTAPTPPPPARIGADGGLACPAPKVVVCHRPEGNTENAHSLCIDGAGRADHVAHGDALGNCPDGGIPGAPGNSGSAPGQQKKLDAGTSAAGAADAGQVI